MPSLTGVEGKQGDHGDGQRERYQDHQNPHRGTSGLEPPGNGAGPAHKISSQLELYCKLSFAHMEPCRPQDPQARDAVTSPTCKLLALRGLHPSTWRVAFDMALVSSPIDSSPRADGSGAYPYRVALFQRHRYSRA